MLFTRYWAKEIFRLGKITAKYNCTSVVVSKIYLREDLGITHCSELNCELEIWVVSNDYSFSPLSYCSFISIAL